MYRVAKLSVPSTIISYPSIISLAFSIVNRVPNISTIISGGDASPLAMAGPSEEEQF